MRFHPTRPYFCNGNHYVESSLKQFFFSCRNRLSCINSHFCKPFLRICASICSQTARGTVWVGMPYKPWRIASPLVACPFTVIIVLEATRYPWVQYQIKCATARVRCCVKRVLMNGLVPGHSLPATFPSRIQLVLDVMQIVVLASRESPRHYSTHLSFLKSWPVICVQHMSSVGQRPLSLCAK